MKKFLVSIVAALMAAPAFAQYSSGGFELDKESMYYGVRFGGTLASVSGDYSVGSKIGMTLAGVIGLRVSSSTPVFLESGLYYTQRGAKDDDWEITSNNFEIPLVIKYGLKATDEIALLPFFGPYFAYAVSSDKKDKRSQADMAAGRTNCIASTATIWASSWVAVLSTTSFTSKWVTSLVSPTSSTAMITPLTTTPSSSTLV